MSDEIVEEETDGRGKVKVILKKGIEEAAYVEVKYELAIVDEVFYLTFDKDDLKKLVPLMAVEDLAVRLARKAIGKRPVGAFDKIVDREINVYSDLYYVTTAVH